MSDEDLITEARRWLQDDYAEQNRYAKFGQEEIPPGATARLIARLTDALEARQIDARDHLHAKCDCVPDLGPAHCHLCSGDGSPVPWSECAAVVEARQVDEAVVTRVAKAICDEAVACKNTGWEFHGEHTRVDHRKQAKAALEEFLGERHDPEPGLDGIAERVNQAAMLEAAGATADQIHLALKIFTAGRITAEDFNQFARRGIKVPTLEPVAPQPRESDVREALLKIIERNSVPRGYEEGLLYSTHKMVDAILAEFPILSRDIAAEIEDEARLAEGAVFGDAYMGGLRRAAEIVRNGR